MSAETIAERARAEAEAAEAETTEPEPEPEGEPEPTGEPEPENGDEEAEEEGEEGEPQAEPAAEARVSQEELERRIAKAERATTAYVKKISEALEEEALSLTECPLCLPFARGFVHLGDAGRIPDDVQKAVLTFMRGVEQVEYKQADGYRACDACDGLGKIKTGSRVPAQELGVCMRCSGNGFLGPGGATTVADNGGAGGVGGTLQEHFTAPQGDADPWGSPRLLADGRENPNYGRMPQFKTADLP